jgi:hypothetical protein
MPPLAVMAAEYALPTVAAGTVRVSMITAASTTSVKARVAVPPFESVTRTVKSNVPSSVGVPEIVVPGVPAGARVNPAGSVPAEIDHVYPAPVPPVAATATE